MSDRELRVELFTQPHCAPCRQVERFLRDRNLEPLVHDVSAEADALEAIIERGFMGTPVTRIGERWIGGYRPTQLDAALREAFATEEGPPDAA